MCKAGLFLIYVSTYSFFVMAFLSTLMMSYALYLDCTLIPEENIPFREEEKNFFADFALVI
jgi:hypothetical protein